MPPLIVLSLLIFIGLIVAWPKYGTIIATVIIAALWALALCVVNLVIALLHAIGITKE